MDISMSALHAFVVNCTLVFFALKFIFFLDCKLFML